MKYFGEYLVEKKIVTPEKVVTAILQQTQNQPLIAQIAYEKNVFTADEMIRIFSLQQEHQMDFLNASRNAGLLTEEKWQIIDKELQQHHVPLASLLLKNGDLALKDLVHALDEFLSTAQRPQLVKESSSNSPVRASVNSEIPSFKFPKIDPTFGLELQGALSENKVAEIVNVLHLVKQNASVKELVQEFLQDVLKNVHTIRGLAKAAQTPVIESLCSNMDLAIVKELRAEIPNTNHIINNLVPAIEEALHFCTKLRNAIAQYQSEAVFWNETNTQESYRSVSQRLAA